MASAALYRGLSSRLRAPGGPTATEEDAKKQSSKPIASPPANSDTAPPEKAVLDRKSEAIPGRGGGAGPAVHISAAAAAIGSEATSQAARQSERADAHVGSEHVDIVSEAERSAVSGVSKSSNNSRLSSESGSTVPDNLESPQVSGGRVPASSEGHHSPQFVVGSDETPARRRPGTLNSSFAAAPSPTSAYWSSSPTADGASALAVPPPSSLVMAAASGAAASGGDAYSQLLNAAAYGFSCGISYAAVSGSAAATPVAAGGGSGSATNASPPPFSFNFASTAPYSVGSGAGGGSGGSSSSSPVPPLTPATAFALLPQMSPLLLGLNSNNQPVVPVHLGSPAHFAAAAQLAHLSPLAHLSLPPPAGHVSPNRGTGGGKSGRNSRRPRGHTATSSSALPSPIASLVEAAIGGTDGAGASVAVVSRGASTHDSGATSTTGRSGGSTGGRLANEGGDGAGTARSSVSGTIVTEPPPSLARQRQRQKTAADLATLLVAGEAVAGEETMNAAAESAAAEAAAEGSPSAAAAALQIAASSPANHGDSRHTDSTACKNCAGAGRDSNSSSSVSEGGCACCRGSGGDGDEGGGPTTPTTAAGRSGDGGGGLGTAEDGVSTSAGSVTTRSSSGTVNFRVALQPFSPLAPAFASVSAMKAAAASSASSAGSRALRLTATMQAARNAEGGRYSVAVLSLTPDVSKSNIDSDDRNSTIVVRAPLWPSSSSSAAAPGELPGRSSGEGRGGQATLNDSALVASEIDNDVRQHSWKKRARAKKAALLRAQDFCRYLRLVALAGASNASTPSDASLHPAQEARALASQLPDASLAAAQAVFWLVDAAVASARRNSSSSVVTADESDPAGSAPPFPSSASDYPECLSDEASTPAAVISPFSGRLRFAAGSRPPCVLVISSLSVAASPQQANLQQLALQTFKAIVQLWQQQGDSGSGSGKLQLQLSASDMDTTSAAAAVTSPEVFSIGIGDVHPSASEPQAWLLIDPAALPLAMAIASAAVSGALVAPPAPQPAVTSASVAAAAAVTPAKPAQARAPSSPQQQQQLADAPSASSPAFRPQMSWSQVARSPKIAPFASPAATLAATMRLPPSPATTALTSSSSPPGTPAASPLASPPSPMTSPMTPLTSPLSPTSGPSRSPLVPLPLPSPAFGAEQVATLTSSSAGSSPHRQQQRPSEAPSPVARAVASSNSSSSSGVATAASAAAAPAPASSRAGAGGVGGKASYASAVGRSSPRTSTAAMTSPRLAAAPSSPLRRGGAADTPMSSSSRDSSSANVSAGDALPSLSLAPPAVPVPAEKAASSPHGAAEAEARGGITAADQDRRIEAQLFTSFDGRVGALLKRYLNNNSHASYISDTSNPVVDRQHATGRNNVQGRQQSDALAAIVNNNSTKTNVVSTHRKRHTPAGGGRGTKTENESENNSNYDSRVGKGTASGGNSGVGSGGVCAAAEFAARIAGGALPSSSSSGGTILGDNATNRPMLLVLRLRK